MGSTASAAEMPSMLHQDLQRWFHFSLYKECQRVFDFPIAIFSVTTSCCVPEEEENALGPHLQVDSNRVHEFVRDVSCMPAD